MDIRHFSNLTYGQARELAKTTVFTPVTFWTLNINNGVAAEYPVKSEISYKGVMVSVYNQLTEIDTGRIGHQLLVSAMRYVLDNRSPSDSKLYIDHCTHIVTNYTPVYSLPLVEGDESLVYNHAVVQSLAGNEYISLSTYLKLYCSSSSFRHITDTDILPTLSARFCLSDPTITSFMDIVLTDIVVHRQLTSVDIGLFIRGSYTYIVENLMNNSRYDVIVDTLASARRDIAGGCGDDEVLDIARMICIIVCYLSPCDEPVVVEIVDAIVPIINSHNTLIKLYGAVQLTMATRDNIDMHVYHGRYNLVRYLTSIGMYAFFSEDLRCACLFL
jgi:hypothetical protein